MILPAESTYFKGRICQIVQINLLKRPNWPTQPTLKATGQRCCCSSEIHTSPKSQKCFVISFRIKSLPDEHSLWYTKLNSIQIHCNYSNFYDIKANLQR